MFEGQSSRKKTGRKVRSSDAFVAQTRRNIANASGKQADGEELIDGIPAHLLYETDAKGNRISASGTITPLASASGSGAASGVSFAAAAASANAAKDAKGFDANFPIFDAAGTQLSGVPAGGAPFEFNFGDDAKSGSAANAKSNANPSAPVPIRMPTFQSGAAASSAASKSPLFSLPLPPLDLGRCQASDQLAVAMSRFWCQEKYSDVCFIVGKTEETRRRIPAHSLLLSARSPIFDQMLHPTTKPAPAAANGKTADGDAKAIASSATASSSAAAAPSSSGARDILITDCTPELFVRMLECVYTDKASITAEEVSGLMELSKKYALECVKRQCSSFLRTRLTPENACVLMEDDALSIQDATYVLAFIQNNLEKILTGSGRAAFLKLSKDKLVAIVRNDQLNCKELPLFRAIVEWAKAARARQFYAELKRKRDAAAAAEADKKAIAAALALSTGADPASVAAATAAVPGGPAHAAAPEPIAVASSAAPVLSEKEQAEVEAAALRAIAFEPLSHIRFGMLSSTEVAESVSNAGVLTSEQLIQIFAWIGNDRSKKVFFSTVRREMAFISPVDFSTQFGAAGGAGGGAGAGDRDEKGNTPYFGANDYRTYRTVGKGRQRG